MEDRSAAAPSGKDKAYFRRDGDRFLGNDAARGPWSANACHAGPVTGLIVRALERAVTNKQLVRLTVSFQRAIPTSGIRTEVVVERDGRATTSTMATLRDNDGRTCASAAGLHLAVHSFAGFPTATIPQPVFADAVKGEFPVQRALHDLPFFGNSIEVRYPPGETGAPGPNTMWMRALPIVEDENSSPFQRLCPIADCGNGIGRNAEFAAASFINVDLTVTVYRLPESDWLASSAISFWEPTGIGMSQATLFDTRGAIGVALQTLLVRPAN